MDSDEGLEDTLQTRLDTFNSEGSVAAKGLLQNANLGLEVIGLGRFGMPLSDSEVQRLISSSRQAPFGTGSETFIDTSVRNTWEIDGSLVSLRDPKWQ